MEIKKQIEIIKSIKHALMIGSGNYTGDEIEQSLTSTLALIKRMDEIEGSEILPILFPKSNLKSIVIQSQNAGWNACRQELLLRLAKNWTKEKILKIMNDKKFWKFDCYDGDTLDKEHLAQALYNLIGDK